MDVKQNWPKLSPRTLLTCILILAVMQAWASPLQASPPTMPAGQDIPTIIDISTVERTSLAPALELLEDSDHRLTFEQIQTPVLQARFQTIGGISPNFGFTSSAWWVRFSLSNSSSQPRQVFIRQDYPLIDHLDFWAQNDGGEWQHIATGDMEPFHQRPVDHRLFVFPVDVPANSELTYYLRFQTQGALNIGLFSHSPLNLTNMISKEYLALGIYYGGFIVLLFYNLFMFLTVRERTFAYYLIYLASYGLYMSLHNGLSFQILVPDYPLLANKALLVLLSISLYGGTLFTRTILNSKAIAPVADRIAYAMQLASLAAMVIAPFVSYHTMIVPLAILTVFLCMHLVLLGLLALSRGTGTARYYMIAFSALLLGVFVYMAKTFGFLPHNAFTQNAFQIGSLLEMVLLSLAVASRLNELKHESSTDALTQLYNRRFFNDQIQIEFNRAQQQGQPLSLVVLDIDHFKRFNDRYGHSKGDSALKAVAGILKAAVRKPYTVCRYGGEEFVLILPSASVSDVAILAERVRRKVEKDTAGVFDLTVSIGFASLDADNFSSPEELFIAADYALYTAKEAGRNCAMDYSACQVRRKEDLGRAEPEAAIDGA
ncbi:diguanylate cyclase [Marinobacter sp. SS21]|uniref:diguanylate cyclase n=1 Tax=Marinobacter sp. SS21 TaxID=2979460 RepID=UPI00232C2ABF|nr:diguanylate cyclase [Marinobacter sp. SS21]MDC0664291.1 sensor domain-containing diguanylate cyclase [Marinobacter sp. SS21]